jgi:hypothetical protein
MCFYVILYKADEADVTYNATEDLHVYTRLESRALNILKIERACISGQLNVSGYFMLSPCPLLSKLTVFLIGIVVRGVQLGPLGMSATSWSIVRAPVDHEDGEFGGIMIGNGNRSTRRKLTPVPLRPPQIPHDLTGREPWPPQWEAND